MLFASKLSAQIYADRLLEQGALAVKVQQWHHGCCWCISYKG